MDKKLLIPKALRNIFKLLGLVKVFVPSYNTNMLIEKKVALTLIKKNKTLALAESCSGGLIADRLTNIPGCSHFLKVGIIAYANETKTVLLGVAPNLLRKFGAVSNPVVRAMAANIRKIHKTDFALATTGIAGPTGQTAQKPIGLVFIAVSSPQGTVVEKFIFRGNRKSIKSQSATKALHLLSRIT